MNEHAKRLITQVAVETLERLAFVFAFPAEVEQPDLCPDSWHASVSFSGPFSGRLAMTLAPDDLAELAGNMLGVEDGNAMTAEQLRDALKETLNVLCGNILPAIAGRDAIFDIHPPRVGTDENASSAGGGSVEAAAVQLSMDEGICTLALYIDEPIPQGLLVPDSADDR